MECPRCGGTVTRYQLGEREAIGCDECAYVGVSVDHTAEHATPESWDDALDRFQEQGQSVTRVTRADLPAEVPDAESGAELVEGELVAETELVNEADLVDEADLVVPVFDEREAEPVDDSDMVLPVFDDAVADQETAADRNGSEAADAGD